MSDVVAPADSVSQVSLTRHDDEMGLMYEDEEDIYGGPPSNDRYSLSDLRDSSPQSVFLYVTEDTLDEARELLTESGFYV
jgi:hypothetical protein